MEPLKEDFEYEPFKAKDIQEILDIPKYRYEYIANKIGIVPEMREADGQGQKHHWSLKNVLQFAYSHYASNLGLTPKSIRKMLVYLDSLENQMIRIKPYDPFYFEVFSIHYVIDENPPYFTVSYDAASPVSVNRILLDDVDVGRPIPGKNAVELYNSMGFITVNISEIKLRLAKKIKNRIKEIE